MRWTEAIWFKNLSLIIVLVFLSQSVQSLVYGFAVLRPASVPSKGQATLPEPLKGTLEDQGLYMLDKMKRQLQEVEAEPDIEELKRPQTKEKASCAVTDPEIDKPFSPKSLPLISASPFKEERSTQANESGFPWLEWLGNLLVSEVHAQTPPDPNLVSTPDANTTDRFIIEKAQELGNDPNTIFAFVRDEIGYESYRGSLRGARGTLWSNAGNALDQASLLIALLRASGIPARYVQGTLSDPLAQELILSMFPNTTRVVGCPPSDAEGADPANDPQLLSETREHYWVELDTGGGFIPSDPTIANAQIGDVFGTVGNPPVTFGEVSDELRHKVVIRLNVEFNNSLTGGLQDPKAVLNQIFNTVELVGHPLSVGNFVDTKTAGGAVFTTTTHTYSPYILIGQNDADISDDDLIRGEDYQELSSNLAFSTTFLTGVFLEMDVLDPEDPQTGLRPEETYVREIFDRLGFASRQNGGTTNIGQATNEESSISQLDLVTINVLPGLQASQALDEMQNRIPLFQQRWAEIQPEVEELPTTGQLSNDQLVLVDRALKLGRDISVMTSQTATMGFASSSDLGLSRLEEGYMSKAYYVSPRLILALTKKNGEEFSIKMDLKKNGVRVIPAPGQVTTVKLNSPTNFLGEEEISLPFIFEVTRGIIESTLEGKVLSRVSGQTVFSIADIWRDLDNQQDLVFLGKDNLQLVEGLNISDNAKARITQAIFSGRGVITPTRMVVIDGEQKISWFEINPITGHTVSVMEDGGHGVFAEFIAVLNFAGSGFAGFVTGNLVGLIVPNIAFVAEYLALADRKKPPFSDALHEAAEDVLGLIVEIGPFIATPIGFVSGFATGFITGSTFGLGMITAFNLTDPAVFPFLSRELFPGLPPITPGGTPSVSFQILLDDFFTVPVAGAEIPSVFKAQIQNLGPDEDTFALSFSQVPNGFTIQSSVPTLTVPAGETGEIGICVIPDGPLGNAGDPATFTADVVSTTDATVTATDTEPFTIPSVPGVTLSSSPASLASAPGLAVSSTLTISSVGNVSLQDVPLTLEFSQDLTVAGLTSPITLGADQTTTQTLLLTPAGSTPLNSMLTATITATLPVAPFSASTPISVQVVSPEALAAAEAADVATELGQDELASTLDTLSETLTSLTQDSSNTLLKSRLIGNLDTLITQVQNDLNLEGFVAALADVRETIVSSTTPTELEAALATLSTILGDVNTLLTQVAAFGVDLSLSPSSAELESGESSEFTLRLQSLGSETTTFQLAVGALPSGVTMVPPNLSDVILAPGEVRDETSPQPVTFTLNQSLSGVTVFPVQVTATTVQASTIVETATAHVSVRPALADVLDVTVAPVVVMQVGDTLAGQAQVLNTANAARSVLAHVEIVDASNNVVGTPIDIPVDLVVGSDPIVVDLGTLSTSGLVEGLHNLRVSLLEADSTPLSGRSAQTPFYLGTPVSAEISASPVIVPTGTSTVSTNIEVRNLTSLASDSVTPMEWAAFNTADAVEFYDPGTGSGGSATNALGPVDFQSVTIGRNGVLILDLGPDGNLAVNGVNNDFIVRDAGAPTETYNVAVSLDGETFTTLSQIGRGTMGFDIAETGLAEVRYIKITDRNHSNQVDVDAVLVINSKGGVQVERVDFSLGVEGLSRSSGSLPENRTGIIAAPVIGNLDGDANAEILVQTNRVSSNGGERLVALDGVSGFKQFTVPSGHVTDNAVAIGDLCQDVTNLDCVGPEIVFPTGFNRLQLLSTSSASSTSFPGKVLWDVPGGGNAPGQAMDPVIANFDSDADPEILARGAGTNTLTVYEADGSISWSVALSSLGRTPPVAADLDDDGLIEVIAPHGTSVSAAHAPAQTGPSAQGEVVWQTVLGGSFFGPPAIADVDGAVGGDPDPEIIVGTDDGFLNILNHDGTILKKIDIDGTQFSPPAIADINNDGRTDIVVSVKEGNGRIYALSLTAEALGNPNVIIPVADVQLWSAAATDQTSGSGISIYDLNGDGIWEVLWNGFGPLGGTVSTPSNSISGGLRILSGADGLLIYHNPRINSRSWYDSPVIADVDGDGHTEIITGDQEGLWILGADELFINARDIWNQHSYHITNVNDDLTIPAAEVPSWTDHNSYRTQRPPAGVLNTFTVDVRHDLPLTGYEVDSGTITPLADSVTASEIQWTEQRDFNDSPILTFQLAGDVTDLAPGETREISLGSMVDVKFTSGAVQETFTIPLPPLSVGAGHGMDLNPPVQTVNPGEQVVFAVDVTNPSSTDPLTLGTVGLEGVTVTFDPSLPIDPSQTVSRNMTIAVPLNAPSGSPVFTVLASTSAGVVDQVQGQLVITDKPAVVETTDEAMGAVLTLDPSQVTGGQGTSTTSVVRMTNTGNVTDTYTLNGSFPAGFTGVFDQSIVEVPAGLTNFREVLLTLTTPVGTTPGDFPFTVTATSTTNGSVQDGASGILSVANLGVGVVLSPSTGTSETAFEVTVTNTGVVAETFDVALGGELGAFSLLPVSEVALNAGEHLVIPITIDPELILFPGDVTLAAVATAQSNSAVKAVSMATVTIPSIQGLEAVMEPEEQILPAPGDAPFLMIVENTGNEEEAYSAEITTTTGPIAGDLTGLDNQPTQVIETFRLPGHSTGALKLNTSLTEIGEGTVTVTVTAKEQSTLSAAPTARVEVPNQPPVADAGSDLTLTLGETALLNGNASVDPDGFPSPLTYQWTLLGHPADSTLTQADVANATNPVASVVPDVLGDYVFQLRVSDGDLETNDEVIVHVNNQLPLAHAGFDKHVETGVRGSLNGSESYDPDGDQLTYVWSLTTVPAESTKTTGDIEGATLPNPTFVPDVKGLYLFTLIVNDGLMASDPDTVEWIAGRPNVSPNADAGQFQFTKVGGVVQLDGRKSVDPDKGPNPLTFEWTVVQVPDGSAIQTADILNAAQPQATLVTDVAGLFVLGLKVSDGLGQDQAQVMIQVLYSNVPPNARAGDDQQVLSGAEVLLNGSASDDPDDGPNVLGFQWQFVSVPGLSSLTDAHLIDAQTATPRFTPDVIGAYVVRLSVSDGEAQDGDNVMVVVGPPPVKLNGIVVVIPTEALITQEVFVDCLVTNDGTLTVEPAILEIEVVNAETGEQAAQFSASVTLAPGDTHEATQVIPPGLAPGEYLVVFRAGPETDLRTLSSTLLTMTDPNQIEEGVFISSQDSFLRKFLRNKNEGAHYKMRVGRFDHNRSVVGFDLSHVSTTGLTKATLVLTIKRKARFWHGNGSIVNAHRLLEPWVEGNGLSYWYHGHGPGVTWNCAEDTNIHNYIPNCSTLWNGGNFAEPTAPGVLHTYGQRGEVSWDVTADVLAGAENGWLIKVEEANRFGYVSYYTREAASAFGDPLKAPRLILEFGGQ